MRILGGVQSRDRMNMPTAGGGSNGRTVECSNAERPLGLARLGLDAHGRSGWLVLGWTLTAARADCFQLGCTRPAQRESQGRATKPRAGEGPAVALGASATLAER